MGEVIAAEWRMAIRQLELARYRVRQQRAAFGGVDRDVNDRLERALRRVWWVEAQHG